MTMTTRRERRQHQKPRRQRHGASRSQGRRGPGRFWIGVGIAGGIVAVVLALQALGVFETGAAAIDVNDPRYNPAGETVGTQLQDRGNTHIQTGQSATYGELPPASGFHWGIPAAPTSWGIKDSELPDEVTVHNLEHGGIVVSYQGLTAEEVEELRLIVRSLRSSGFNKVVMQPYSKMTDARIAVTAWTWQARLQDVDDVQIIKFVRAHYEGPDAPEPRVP